MTKCMVQRQLQTGNDGPDLILVLITVAVVAGGMAILICCGCACCWGFRLQIRQLLFRDASRAADDVVSDTVAEERSANTTTVPDSPVPPSVSIAVDTTSANIPANIRNNMSRTQISRGAQSQGHRAEKLPPTPPPRQGHREEKTRREEKREEKTHRKEKREEKAASPSHVTPRTLSRTNSGYARPQTPRARETTLARARR